MNTYKKVDVYKLCRLCMRVDGIKHHLFNSHDGHDRQLPSKLKKCIPLQFKEDDPLPKGICDNCIEKIEQYHNFIDQCVNAESKLTSYYASFGVSDQSKYKETPVITSTRNGIESMKYNYTVADNSNQYVETDSSNDKNDANENVQTNNSVLDMPSLNQEDNKININSHPYVTQITVEPEIFHFQFNESESNAQDSNTDNSKSTVSDDIKTNMNNVNNAITSDGSFVSCPACRKVLESEKEIMTHNKTCEILKRYKKGLQNARQRIARKNLLPKYLCDICEKIFKRKEHLVQHLKRHTGERPYSCEICAKSFIRKEHLNKHTLSHERQEMYACDMCNKHFYCEDNLLNHKIVHSVTGPFVCKICGKSFMSKHHYDIHKCIAQ